MRAAADFYNFTAECPSSVFPLTPALLISSKLSNCSRSPQSVVAGANWAITQSGHCNLNMQNYVNIWD